MGLGDIVRVAEGDNGLDDAPVLRHLQRKAVLCFAFNVPCWHVFRLDDNGRAAGRGDEDVGFQRRMPGDGLSVLGPHLAAGQHALQEIAQGVVGVRLRLARHATL